MKIDNLELSMLLNILDNIFLYTLPFLKQQVCAVGREWGQRCESATR